MPKLTKLKGYRDNPKTTPTLQERDDCRMPESEQKKNPKKLVPNRVFWVTNQCVGSLLRWVVSMHDMMMSDEGFR